MARKDEKGFAFEVRHSLAENRPTPRFLVEHGSQTREECSGAHKRIVRVARIDVIGEYVKPYPGFECGPKPLAVEARHLSFRPALCELEEHVLRVGARGPNRALQSLQQVLATINRGKRRAAVNRAR